MAYQQCNHQIEKRRAGRRYVDSRRQCRNMTRHASGYCHHHRVLWNFKHADEDK